MLDLHQKIYMNKYVVGIVTCDRSEFCHNLIGSIKDIPMKYPVFIENTGTRNLIFDQYKIDIKSHQFQRKTPVVYGKNALFRRMMRETDADYFFILEDDIVINNPDVFDIYIKASQNTGIEHFNFGFSQKENLDQFGKPLVKKILDYPDGTKLILTHNILGAFSMYSRRVIEECGIMDEMLNENAVEHVDHTYRIIQTGFLPPFWWFPDVDKSWDLIGNQGDVNSTVVRNNPDYSKCFLRALEYFRKKHNLNLLEIRSTPESFVVERAKEIYLKYRKTDKT